jgi:hypothetical protein
VSDVDEPERPPMLLDAAGGGATTFEPSVTPALDREPLGFPEALLVATDGGGGTTFVARVERAPPFVPLELTVGGGGTASDGPNIFPIKLLMKPVGCVGGGGTTARAGSEMLPLARRRISCETSLDGGGAMTDGAGSVSLEFLFVARSGAETGGGTTDTFVICTGALESSRLTALGAGAITPVLRTGADRVLSRVMLGAGATTLAVSDGAVRL